MCVWEGGRDGWRKEGGFGDVVGEGGSWCVCVGECVCVCVCLCDNIYDNTKKGNVIFQIHLKL